MQSLALDTISTLMAPPCAPPAQVPPNSRLLGPVPPRHLHWGRESNSNDQKQTTVFFPKMAPPLTIFPSWKQLYLFSCSGKTKQKTSKQTNKTPKPNQTKQKTLKSAIPLFLIPTSTRKACRMSLQNIVISRHFHCHRLSPATESLPRGPAGALHLSLPLYLCLPTSYSQCCNQSESVMRLIPPLPLTSQWLSIYST